MICPHKLLSLDSPLSSTDGDDEGIGDKEKKKKLKKKKKKKKVRVSGPPAAAGWLHPARSSQTRKD